MYPTRARSLFCIFPWSNEAAGALSLIWFRFHTRTLVLTIRVCDSGILSKPSLEAKAKVSLCVIAWSRWFSAETQAQIKVSCDQFRYFAGQSVIANESWPQPRYFPRKVWNNWVSKETSRGTTIFWVGVSDWFCRKYLAIGGLDLTIPIWFRILFASCIQTVLIV